MWHIPVIPGLWKAETGRVLFSCFGNNEVWDFSQLVSCICIYACAYTCSYKIFILVTAVLSAAVFFSAITICNGRRIILFEIFPSFLPLLLNPGALSCWLSALPLSYIPNPFIHSFLHSFIHLLFYFQTGSC